MSTAPKDVELRLRAAVESAPSGLLMIDANGTIVLLNREVERMFGYSREELLGQSVDVLVPESARPRHPLDRATFMRDPRVRAMGQGRELFGRRKDGSDVPVEIGLTPVVTEDGLYVLSAIVDISARKQAEAERHRLEEQLRQSQKMEALGTLAGGVAHDFNNLLGAISGYAELARDEAGDATATRSHLLEVLKAAQRGKSLVERILAFSRRQELRREPLDLRGAVRDAVHLLRATLPATVEIREELAAAVPRVRADTTSVHQVVMNLMTNGAQAMPTGGHLEIAVGATYLRDSCAREKGVAEGHYVTLAVRDEGTGMSDAVRARVFEPFFTTKAPGSGSGLGLAMVHGIMRAHEGAVAIKSAEGAGTTVRCYFPVSEAEEIAGSPMTPEMARGNGERILFVDDEPQLVRIGQRRLEMLGYLVTAADGPERVLAMDAVQLAGFDVVLVDYTMPGMSGLALATELTRRRPGLPIAMLTGFIDDMPAEVLKAAGVRRVVKKPLAAAELAAVVRELLAMRAGG